MTLRQDMQEAVGCAAARWPEPAARAARYLRDQADPGGGYRDRAGRGDLYYTAFALQGLRALGSEIPADDLERYLRTFGGGNGLDLVHAAALARAWTALAPSRLDDLIRHALLRRVESFRAADGGYHGEPGAARGSVYGCFLALGACQDLDAEMRDRAGLLRCVESLASPAGSFANEPGFPAGTTPVNAAALLLFRALDAPPPPAAVAWLLARALPRGGFQATPDLPAPDLLSTATALHALAALGAPLDPLRRPCAEFVLGLQTPEGGFRGQALDDRSDCEYTVYALLALGAL